MNNEFAMRIEVRLGRYRSGTALEQEGSVSQVVESQNPPENALPRWRNFSGNDFAAGALCIGIAFLVLWSAQNLQLGTVRRMGPGYFPTALACILIGFGVALVVMAFLRGREVMEAWRVGPVIAVCAAVLLFGLAMPYLGLFTTVLATVLVGGLATSESRWQEVLVLGVLIALGSHLLFIVGLGLPLAAWPNFF
jgi:hypothetical protein